VFAVAGVTDVPAGGIRRQPRPHDHCGVAESASGRLFETQANENLILSRAIRVVGLTNISVEQV
jgi:hypothetical protein